ncbi:nitroreductase/quinone reductase family protein [Ktedonospora formicarum]|uniref:nitroreductase/quinone reductase family protein n=1 Tax=Ktedonospora formicarum TaxID=2778364 RepID=UPI001C68B03B
MRWPPQVRRRPFVGDGPKNTDWYYNLVAHPEATIEVGTEGIVNLTIELKNVLK